MILTKLNEIENNLTELMNEEESSAKLNHITSSQITLRYNPIIEKSYKASRGQFNKTFCVSRDSQF